MVTYLGRVASLWILVVCAGIVSPAVAAEPRHRDAAVQQEYEALGSLDATQRRAYYVALPAPARTELWRLHLLRMLASRATLSVEERGVLYQALGLLDGGVIERAHSGDDAVAAAARAELDALTRRAKTELARDVSIAAFESLGPPDDEAMEFGGRPKCSCSTESDWCWFAMCYTTMTCQPTQGCGTFLEYYCNGRCSDGT